MNIGLMIDGVLANVSTFLINEGEKYFKRTPSNLKGTTISEIFGCSDLEEEEFWRKNFIKCFLFIKSINKLLSYFCFLYSIVNSPAAAHR